MRGCRLSRRGRGELLKFHSPKPQHTSTSNHRGEARVLSYPCEASRTPRKDPVTLHHLHLPPRVRPAARVGARGTARGGALDVVVETFNDVAGTRLFEIGGLVAEYLVFESSLGKEGKFPRQKDMHVAFFRGKRRKGKIPCFYPVTASFAEFPAGPA